eukprot:GHVU01148155.1.p1 GENE.GHVU01148155.1~~GHVU01148155.1.p1  ORF type:complete len:568 (+),score=57.15 GHVU01148155.1:321-2024(+)
MNEEREEEPVTPKKNYKPIGGVLLFPTAIDSAAKSPPPVKPKPKISLDQRPVSLMDTNSTASNDYEEPPESENKVSHRYSAAAILENRDDRTNSVGSISSDVLSAAASASAATKLMTPTETETETAAAAPAQQAQGRWKLSHIDFLPRLIKEKTFGEDEYEKYQTLVEKANKWLADNKDARLYTIETLRWSGQEKADIFSDNSIIFKTFDASKKTKVIIGLRLWYFNHGEQFWVEETAFQYKVAYRNYVPESEKSTTGTLLSKMRESLHKSPVAGQISKIETLYGLYSGTYKKKEVDPELCYWREQPENSRQLYTFFRVHYFQTSEAVGPVDVGIRDFVPEYSQRSSHNKGYETYADVFRRAAKWAYQEKKLHCINAQSLFVKYKGEKQVKSDSEADFWGKCFFTEHGSAHRTTVAVSHKTEYMQIIRMVYIVKRTEAEAEASSRAKLSYATFPPAKVPEPPQGKPDDHSTLIKQFEDTRQTVDRANVWIAHTGAQLFGVETASVRLRSGGQESLGPEATLVFNCRDRYFWEPWIFHVRLFLNGEYWDTPTSVGYYYTEQNATKQKK